MRRQRAPQGAGNRTAAGSSRTLFLWALLVVLAVSGYQVFGRGWWELTDTRFAPRCRIDLTEPSVPNVSSEPKPTDAPTLAMAVAPVISPEKSLSLYDGLVGHLAGKLGRTPVLMQRPTYAETNGLIRQRACDLGFVCTYAFVLGEQTFGMEVLAVPVIRGSVTYRSLLVAPAGRNASTLLDFRGERMASADLLSWTGWVYPATCLIERGEDPHHFFREHLVAGSHDRAVGAVVEGLAEVAAVDSVVFAMMVEDEPGLFGKVRVVDRSPPFGMPPIVLHPRTDPVLRERLREILLAMHETPDGREVLAQLRIDRFVAPDDRSYDPVRKGAELWETHR